MKIKWKTIFKSIIVRTTGFLTSQRPYPRRDSGKGKLRVNEAFSFYVFNAANKQGGHGLLTNVFLFKEKHFSTLASQPLTIQKTYLLICIFQELNWTFPKCYCMAKEWNWRVNIRDFSVKEK